MLRYNRLPMGQVALGIRSLLIKATVFFIMCALLVWALGGQLFPAPEIVDRAAVPFGGQSWFWRLEAGGDEPGAMHWKMMKSADGKNLPADDKRWSDVAGPIVVDDTLYYAGHPDQNTQPDWLVTRLTQSDSEMNLTVYTFPDRLAVEQQLERLRRGLSLQDVETIRSQRPTVLDPQPGLADELAIPGDDELTERPLNDSPGN